MNWRWLSLAGLCLCLSGCYLDQLPDPNDMSVGAYIDPRIMQRNIAMAHQDLSIRVRRGELTEVRKDQLIRELAEKFAQYIRLEDIPDSEAYRYADILRQANRLAEAKAALETAVKVADSGDRMVNDKLQLARVMAMLGEVEPAIKIARETFEAPPKEKAPILMSILYELAPVATGKGQDVELANLLIDAIDQQLLVQVDPESEAGKAFLKASETHVANAWQTSMKLYNDAGREDLMRKALDHRDSVAKRLGNF